MTLNVWCICIAELSATKIKLILRVLHFAFVPIEEALSCNVPFGIIFSESYAHDAIDVQYYGGMLHVKQYLKLIASNWDVILQTERTCFNVAGLSCPVIHPSDLWPILWFQLTFVILLKLLFDYTYFAKRKKQ